MKIFSKIQAIQRLFNKAYNYHSNLTVYINCKMIHKKYKMFKNHGLLPKIHQKSLEQTITTYALLNKCFRKQYQLHIHPSDSKKLVLFNASEYLHRHCSMVTVDSNPRETIKQISKLYPSASSSLTVFVANDPQEAQRLILGLESQESLLSLAFEDLHKQKDSKSQIFLSIIGVQNENALTDELYFQWIKNSEELSKQKQPIRKIIESKSKIKLIKHQQRKAFEDQNISKHIIRTQDTLTQILKRYTQIKTYLQGWISQKEKRQYYMMGEIYKLFLVEYDSQKQQILKTIKTHYVFRINQYIRTTSPLLLKLGMNLKRIAQENFKCLEIHDSRVFKLLSQCFVKHQLKNKPAFDFHIFMQVGQYQNFKEQFICLNPVSQYLADKVFQDYEEIYSLPYFYSKNFLLHQNIMSTILQIQSKLPQNQKNQMRQVLKKYQFSHNPQKIFQQLSNQIANFDSIGQRKLFRNRSVTQNSENIRQDLQQFVHRTSKIRVLPRIRSKEASLNHRNLAVTNSISKKIKNSEKGYFICLKKQLSSFSPFSRQDSKISKDHKLIEKVPVVKSSFLAQPPLENPLQSSSAQKISKFYQETKQWLGFVYGKRKFKNIKPFYKKSDQKSSNSIRNSKELFKNEIKPNTKQQKS